MGLSLGWVTVIWLPYSLSEADHRLNHGEPWAEQRLQTLRGCTGQRGHPLDVSDDHLSAVLEALRDDARWSAFEGTLNQHLRRVYDWRPERGRRDRTTASGDWRVTGDGLFPVSHRQDHRPALPQVKVMVGKYYITHRHAAGLRYRVEHDGRRWAVTTTSLLWRV